MNKHQIELLYFMNESNKNILKEFKNLLKKYDDLIDKIELKMDQD